MAILKALKAYAKRALEKNVKAVILIGSLAKGNYTAFSDADVVIISDSVPEDLLGRIKIFFESHITNRRATKSIHYSRDA